MDEVSGCLADGEKLLALLHTASAWEEACVAPFILSVEMAQSLLGRLDLGAIKIATERDQCRRSIDSLHHTVAQFKDLLAKWHADGLMEQCLQSRERFSLAHLNCMLQTQTDDLRILTQQSQSQHQMNVDCCSCVLETDEAREFWFLYFGRATIQVASHLHEKRFRAR